MIGGAATQSSNDADEQWRGRTPTTAYRRSTDDEQRLRSRSSLCSVDAKKKRELSKLGFLI